MPLKSFVQLLPLLAVLSSCIATETAKRSDSVQHAIEIGTPISLDIESRNGSVTIEEDAAALEMRIDVEYSARGEDLFEAEERVAEFSLEVRKESDGTHVIRVVTPDGWRMGDAAKFRVVVPEAGPMKVKTSNGRIQLTGAAGDSKLVTSNGRVTAEQTMGNLRIETSNGAVHISEHHGPVEVDTSNGSIHLVASDECMSPFDLDSSNGKIQVELGALWQGNVRASTSNGSITHRSAGATVAKGKGNMTIKLGEQGESSRVGTSNGSVLIEVR